MSTDHHSWAYEAGEERDPKAPKIVVVGPQIPARGLHAFGAPSLVRKACLCPPSRSPKSISPHGLMPPFSCTTHCNRRFHWSIGLLSLIKWTAATERTTPQSPASIVPSSTTVTLVTGNPASVFWWVGRGLLWTNLCWWIPSELARAPTLLTRRP